MSRVNVTESAIKKARREATAKGVRVELSDRSTDGLRFRAMPSGAASWALVCRDSTGRVRRFTIGRYPAIGIADARDKAKRLRQAVRDGADPVAERRQKRAKSEGNPECTLRTLLDIYGGPLPGRSSTIRPIGPGRRLKSWSDARQRIERVFGAFLDTPLQALDRCALQLAADSHKAAFSGAAAVRYLRPILKWAATRRYVAEDVANLRPPVTPRRRHRVLTDDELGRVLRYLRASERAHDRLMLFGLLTLARRGEIAAARWRDFDIERREWTIPETKSGSPHKVPLSRQAVALLRRIGPGKPDALAFATRTGGALSNWQRALRRVHAATDTTNWHRHDLRRTGATLLGEQRIAPHIIELALGHADAHSRLASVYNRARYFSDVAAALQKLADLLDEIGSENRETLRDGEESARHHR